MFLFLFYNDLYYIFHLLFTFFMVDSTQLKFYFLVISIILKELNLFPPFQVKLLMALN